MGRIAIWVYEDDWVQSLHTTVVGVRRVKKLVARGPTQVTANEKILNRVLINVNSAITSFLEHDI